jgi:hypothetical protein
MVITRATRFPLPNLAQGPRNADNIGCPPVTFIDRTSQTPALHRGPPWHDRFDAVDAKYPLEVQQYVAVNSQSKFF